MRQSERSSHRISRSCSSWSSAVPAPLRDLARSKDRRPGAPNGGRMRSKDLRPGLACSSGKGLHSKEVRAVRDAAPACVATSSASTADAAAALEAGEAGWRPELELAPLLHRVVTPAAAASAALHGLCRSMCRSGQVITTAPHSGNAACTSGAPARDEGQLVGRRMKGSYTRIQCACLLLRTSRQSAARRPPPQQPRAPATLSPCTACGGRRHRVAPAHHVACGCQVVLPSGIGWVDSRTSLVMLTSPGRPTSMGPSCGLRGVTGPRSQHLCSLTGFGPRCHA